MCLYIHQIEFYFGTVPDQDLMVQVVIHFKESEGTAMARRCELTGKAVLSGNLVSHSNRKTRRRFLPNLCHVTLASEVLNQSFRLRITAHALRTVEHRGGLDSFLLKAKELELSQHARELRRAVSKASKAEQAA